MQIKKIIDYNDATKGTWKEILDHWWGGRFEEGRGVVFTDLKTKDLISSETGRESSLPRFWKEALIALRERAMPPLTRLFFHKQRQRHAGMELPPVLLAATEVH